MTKSQYKKLLSASFEMAIDGGCSNAYRYVLQGLENCGLDRTEHGKVIYQVLKPLSKKWGKEIDLATQ